MNIKGVLVLFLVLFVYFSIHFFVYFSSLNFFSITNHTLKKVFLFTFIFLFFSFIISAALSRLSDFILFRIYYGISAFWIGLVFNLLIASMVAWVLIYIFKQFSLNTSNMLDLKIVIGSIVYLFTLIFCLYGLWNAFHPIIKQVDIKLKNLPQVWQGKSIVQLSDMHLGKIHGAGFAQKVVEQVNELNPEIVVITGDLFDGMASKPEFFINIIDKLQAKRGVYFITGNHEGYLGSGEILKLLEQSKLKILNNEVVELDGMQIIGISYPAHSKSQDKTILDELEGYNPNKINILLYHIPASIEKNKASMIHQQIETYWQPRTDFSLVKKEGIDLQLSGHTHAGQFFPFTILADWIYNGFNYGLFKDGDFNLYVSSGVGTWGPPIRTGHKSEIVNIILK